MRVYESLRTILLLCLRRKPGPECELILIGGKYRFNSGCTIGSFAEGIINQLNVSKTFIGADGISLKSGITSPVSEEAAVTKMMIERTAGQVITAADSTKIGQMSTFYISALDSIDYLVTDENFDENYRPDFEEARNRNNKSRRILMAYQDQYKECEWIEFEVLENFMKDCLVKSGVPEADAKIVSDVLIESDKRGIDSHGIGRLKPIYIDRIDWGILNPETKIDVVKETATTAVLDGNNGMGHVVAKEAMQKAIDKAKENGMGMVAVRNSTHYGIAGYYSLMACDNGMIGITGTNARPSIAPTFGVENMLGTNPLL